MKYFSEKLDKMFDTTEELKAAEKQYDKKMGDIDSKIESAQAACETAKDDYNRAVDACNKAGEVYVKAKKVLSELINKKASMVIDDFFSDLFN